MAQNLYFHIIITPCDDHVLYRGLNFTVFLQFHLWRNLLLISDCQLLMQMREKKFFIFYERTLASKKRIEKFRGFLNQLQNCLDGTLVGLKVFFFIQKCFQQDPVCFQTSVKFSKFSSVLHILSYASFVANDISSTQLYSNPY